MVVSCLSLSLSPPSLLTPHRYPSPTALVPLGEPAGEKFLLLRINGIVCLALTRRSYRDRQTIFFLLEITREARLGWPGRQRRRGCAVCAIVLQAGCAVAGAHARPRSEPISPRRGRPVDRDWEEVENR